MKTRSEARPKNHTFTLAVIELAMSMVIVAGVSFRGASKVFVMLNLYLDLNLRTPTHTTILNWTKKQGVGNFREKSSFDRQKWILIADESVQFGNKKLLFITVFPANYKFGGEYLKYSELAPLVIKVSPSWKGADIAKEISASIDPGQILYAVSDNGGNLTNAFKSLGITHIEDINHKFSRVMEKVLEDNETFKAYVKELSGMRAKLPLSKLARIIPPNQRVVSRYMNLAPIFAWGMKMLKLLETNRLTTEEKARLSFLDDYKEFVAEMHGLIDTLNQVQDLLKTRGFSRENARLALKAVKAHDGAISQEASKMIADYFHNTRRKMRKQKRIVCSSDIMESCFSKYKALTKANKTVGISDLALCLSAMLRNDLQTTQVNFEKTKTKDVNAWKQKNIAKTLFSEKMELLKNTG